MKMKTLFEVFENPFFDIQRVLDIENEALIKLDAKNHPANSYFKEEVASYLYKEYLKNTDDTRIIEYALPLIQMIMYKRKYIFIYKEIDPLEVFNSLTLILLESLPTYKEDKGKIYSYFTFLVSNRILTLYSQYNNKGKNTYPLEDYDKPIDNTEHETELLSFTLFIKQYIKISTGSLQKILTVLDTLISNNTTYNIQDRQALIKAMYLLLDKKYPDILIEQALNFIIERYTHSILD